METDPERGPASDRGPDEQCATSDDACPAGHSVRGRDLAATHDAFRHMRRGSTFAILVQNVLYSFSMARTPKARQQVLDAAARIVRERGAAALTFEELAGESGVTRGGITYHFPTKDDLLRALVERDRQRWSETLGQHGATPGAAVAGRLVAYVRTATTHDPEHRRFVSGMLSAVAHQPELLDGCRALYRDQLPVLDGGDAALDALVVLLAADGLFWMEQLGFLDLPMAVREQLIGRLEALAHAAALPSPSPDSKT
jgi:AcrR family transcriptional regulator